MGNYEHGLAKEYFRISVKTNEVNHEFFRNM